MQRRHFLTSPLGALLASPAAAQELASPNEVVQKAREGALGVLKPSKKDLEHGLELHRNSLVFESYGFMPRAAADGAVLAQLIDAGASEAEYQDAYEDQTMTRYVTEAAERKEYLDAWRTSGVTCIFQNSGEEGSDPRRLLKRLARYTYTTHFLRDHVSQAVEPADIEAAKKAGRHCVYMTTNGVPIPGAWTNVNEELTYIRIFFEMGVRMMHLTYNRRNMIGDGCGEPANAGLSDFGRAAVAEMNRLGVIVDIAHSGWQTSLEAAKASKKPMVASHTTCTALHRHIRSKPDEVIRAICDTGGLVGICSIPGFLGGARNIGSMLDHIDYVIKKFGADHVAIGTDIAYSSRNSAGEMKKVPRRARARIRWEALWPPGSSGGEPDTTGSLAWVNWPLFTVGMVQRGHSDTDIQKVLGLNMLRVARGNFNGIAL
ncbi:MAG: membrane dipeptidase [Bryobacterales bacterium]|nr:membrane dipeptidase [Bryobacterales bacterium]